MSIHQHHRQNRAGPAARLQQVTYLPAPSHKCDDAWKHFKSGSVNSDEPTGHMICDLTHPPDEFMVSVAVLVLIE